MRAQDDCGQQACESGGGGVAQKQWTGGILEAACIPALSFSRTATFKLLLTPEYLVHTRITGPRARGLVQSLRQGLRSCFADMHPCDTPVFTLGTLL